MHPELSDGDMEDKQGSKSPHQLEMDEQNKVNHEHDKKDGSHIECKYMRAAHGFLSNTTFHGITWVLEDFSSYVKVGVDNTIIHPVQYFLTGLFLVFHRLLLHLHVHLRLLLCHCCRGRVLPRPPPEGLRVHCL